MRIVHLTDIHLSKKNFSEFQNNYRKALIRDLEEYHNDQKIDIIAITGDLVDKGGHSLKELREYKKGESPFSFFEREFIKPIMEALDLTAANFLFVPGNHDVDESEILWIDEKELKENIDLANVNDKLDLNRFSFSKENKRIQLFKEFEKKFYSDLKDSYNFSNNESTYVYNLRGEVKVGFIMVNDSWRCSSCKVENSDLNKHYFGYNQLYDGLRKLDETPTRLNICLFHHQIANYEENSKVLVFLRSENIGLYLFGHEHSIDQEPHFSIDPKTKLNGFRSRAALNNPEEPIHKYQAGYQIFDINTNQGIISKIHYRRYHCEDIPGFVVDAGSWAKNGIDESGHPIRVNESVGSKSAFKSEDLKMSNFKRFKE